MTVEQAIELDDKHGGCDTGLCRGLSNQLVGKIIIIAPGILVPIPADRVIAQTRVNLYLQAAAQHDFMSALGEHPGHRPVITSMLRTLPQQVMVNRWHAVHRCGIPKAAAPGESRHEQGRAVDTPDVAFRSSLVKHGWVWYGPGDKEHCSHSGQELGHISIRAFQTLANERGGAHLTVDGVLGDHTMAVLLGAPCAGWH